VKKWIFRFSSRDVKQALRAEGVMALCREDADKTASNKVVPQINSLSLRFQGRIFCFSSIGRDPFNSIFK